MPPVSPEFVAVHRSGVPGLCCCCQGCASHSLRAATPQAVESLQPTPQPPAPTPSAPAQQSTLPQRGVITSCQLCPAPLPSPASRCPPPCLHTALPVKVASDQHSYSCSGSSTCSLDLCRTPELSTTTLKVGQCPLTFGRGTKCPRTAHLPFLEVCPCPCTRPPTPRAQPHPTEATHASALRNVPGLVG